MDTLQQLNQAMAYLETHLYEEVDPVQLSRAAGCSEYHFRRMFSYLAGMPLGEYIRRRRLSEAAVQLLTTDARITDLAFDCGYATPEAFTKAFAAMHGVPPTRARQAKTPLKAFPPMTFRLTIKGGTEMNYRIVEKQAFRIVGFGKRVTLQFEGVNSQIVELTQRLNPQNIPLLKGLCNTEPAGILNVSANFSDRTTEGSELDQYIGVATTAPAPDGFDSLEVAPATWAVFTSVGPYPAALQETWARIYAEWLPGSGYELTGGPELVWSEGPDMTKPDFKNEIWLPVRPLN